MKKRFNKFLTLTAANLAFFGLITVVFAVVMSFQNCTQSSRHSFWQPSLEADLSTNGNGGTYDGKPEEGTYYRVIPDYRCGNEFANYGEIEITREKLTVRTLEPSACTPQESQISLDQLELSAFNRRLLGFSDGIYERRLSAPSPVDREIAIPEVWCRADSNSEAHGLEVVVRTAPATAKATPTLTKGIVTSDHRVLSSDQEIADATRVVSGRTLVYSGSDFELTLDLENSSTNVFRVPARLKTVMGSERFDLAMSCRRGSSLDVQAPLPALTCPINYVRVPAVAGYSESEFCIAKYEAKSAGTLAVSRPEGVPWTMVDRSTALASCAANGIGYDLIANNEWMAAARNMESVAWNWSGNTVGSGGGLNTGHSDNNPQSVLAASNNDDNPCFQTGQTCSLMNWSSQRRVHQFTNGELVWDMAGNAWEWMKDWDRISYGNTDYYMSLVTDVATKNRFGPSGDYTGLTTPPYGGLGMGEVAAGNIGTILRGGMYTLNDQSGLFAFSTQVQPTSIDPGWGFRCVYHP